MTGHDRSWWEVGRDEDNVVVELECSCHEYREEIATTKYDRDADVTAAFQSHLDSLEMS